MCTGKKTKEIDSFQGLPKTYDGIFTLGKSSPSMDLETEINSEKSTDDITEEMILQMKEYFVGKIEQIPPMYSAVKLKGKRFIQIARKGKDS